VAFMPRAALWRKSWNRIRRNPAFSKSLKNTRCFRFCISGGFPLPLAKIHDSRDKSLIPAARRASLRFFFNLSSVCSNASETSTRRIFPVFVGFTFPRLFPPQIPSTALCFSRPALCCGLDTRPNDSGMFRSNAQERKCGAMRHAPSLFPVPESMNADTQSSSKLHLRQSYKFPECGNLFA
jgi:hypothetical protein